MASVFHLYNDAFNIKRKIVQKYADFAEADKKLYFSAVAIQRSWRGYILRKKIENWHKQATEIQRFVRGWLVRLHLPEIYKNYYYDQSVAYYNRKAELIQAIWKGWRVRIRARSARSIIEQRYEIESISKEMQDHLGTLLKSTKLTGTEEYVQKILAILFDRHHLLRTKAHEGVFSKHGSYELSCTEKILKSFQLTEYMKKWRKITNKDFQHLSNAQPETERKEFDLYTRAKPKPYKRMLLPQDK